MMHKQPRVPALLALNQEIADRIVGDYAVCRERSIAAWKRMDASQRDALTRYRTNGFVMMNRLVRGSAHTSSKDNDDDWHDLVSWSKPASHHLMTPGKHIWGPEATDCALYETPIGSLARVVANVQSAVRDAVVALDGVFAAKAAAVTPAPLMLFRGVTARAISACAVGAAVSQPGFLSTSLSPMVARSFMNMNMTQAKRRRCMLVVHVPAGVPFVFFDGITGGQNDRANEMEILFSRGASLRKLAAGREMSDPSMFSRTASGAKGNKKTITVIDVELVVPAAAGSPPALPTASAGDAAAVRLFPSGLARMRTEACGESQ